MRVRHKIPNVFSLSMLDVLCCALGCVILLWLLGAKQNEDETRTLRDEVVVASERGAKDLAAANSDLVLERDRAVRLEAQLAQRIIDLQRLREEMGKETLVAQKRADDVEGRLRVSLARLADLEAAIAAGATSLEAEKKKSKSTDSKLAAAESSLKTVRADLDSEKKGVLALRRRLTELEGSAASRTPDLKKLTQSLSEAEAARKQLAGTLETRGKELSAAETARKRLAGTLETRDKELLDSKKRERDAEALLRERTAAMAEATRAHEALKKEAGALRLAARQVEKDKEGRFAGIALSGKRVVFLVDMSGSMALVDRDTESPEKWPEVCETVGRVMRSLPDLEKYQIICFSTKLTYPLGGEGKWRDFDAKKTPDQAVKVLREVKPFAGTNMYVALKAAFDLRADGLDTVYVLSDGLPNHGEGLTKDQENTLKELERGLVLGRHVRKKLKEEWNKPDDRKRRVKIHTIGFFYESPDLGSFLWALARENDGSFVGMSKP